jgi:RNA polymerase sigma-70 factor (ECF subfamily)
MIPTRANGQAAFVVYEQQADRYIAHGVNVLTFIGDRIARITLFNDSDLVRYFER